MINYTQLLTRLNSSPIKTEQAKQKIIFQNIQKNPTALFESLVEEGLMRTPTDFESLLTQAKLCEEDCNKCLILKEAYVFAESDGCSKTAEAARFDFELDLAMP